MGDQPDENTKEFSKEELNVWNVEKLRKYLKDRQGIVITSDTRKGDLISKVYYASRLHLQLCSTKEQEEAEILARRKGKTLNGWNIASFSRGSSKLVVRKSIFPRYDND